MISSPLQPPPEIFLFIGRLHVLLVHLPIGMLAALAALEVAARVPRFKNANASAGFILALAAPLAVVTVVCGWLLSLGGGYEENLLAWHKWLGTGTAAGCLVAAILFYRRKFNAYRASLFVTVALLMAAGHLGGSLTHGSDYLARYAPWPLKKLLGATGQEKKQPAISVKNPQQLPVFAGVIAPVFQNKCVNCHGAVKSKGGLRLDSFAAVMKGSKDGLVLKPGGAAQSPLVQRVLLPADNDDHMPPSGKPPLTADEIALLKWWIDAGAVESKTVAELRPPPEILQIIASKAR
ncbi:MAG TPA: c-type cytochrome domain-containing protein [Verrucomicrobiae bacterium]